MSYIELPLSVILSAIMIKEGGVSMNIYDGEGFGKDAVKHRQFAGFVDGKDLDLMLDQGRLEITCRGGDPNKFKTIYHTVTDREEIGMSTKVDATQLEKACNILYSFSYIPPEADIYLTDERIILTNKARNMSVSLPGADRPPTLETGPDPEMTNVDRNFSRALKRAFIARSRDKDSPLSNIFLEMSDGSIMLRATDKHILAKSIVAPISFSNDLQPTHLSVDAQKFILAEQLVRGGTRKSGRICLNPDPDNHQLIMRNPKSGVEVRLPYNKYDPDFFRGIVPDVNLTDTTTFNAYELRQRMGMFKTGKYDVLKIGSAKENDQWLMTVTQKGLIAQGKEQVREFFPFDIATSVTCSGGFEERIVRATYLKNILAGTTVKDGQLDLQISKNDPRATFRSQDGTSTCVMMTRSE